MFDQKGCCNPRKSTIGFPFFQETSSPRAKDLQSVSAFIVKPLNIFDIEVSSDEENSNKKPNLNSEETSLAVLKPCPINQDDATNDSQAVKESMEVN